MSKNIVRQYRPAYVSGFKDGVYDGVAKDDILKLPFCKNFEYDGFVRFETKLYRDDESIIVAYYADGKYWVVGFFIPETSPLRNEWRYAGATSPLAKA